MNAELSATGTRLLALRKKLKAREGKPWYEKNCEMIRAEISRLEGVTARPADTIADSDGNDGA